MIAENHVIILKSICAHADLFAFAVAPIDTNKAVIVVPIFAPIIALADSVIGNHAVRASVIIIAMETLDDCIIIVRINPTIKNANTDKKPFHENEIKSICDQISEKDP